MKPLRRAERRLFGPLILTAGALTAACVVASSVVASIMARTVIIPPRGRSQDVRVLGIDEPRGRITLARTPDTELPGRYGLWYGRPERYVSLGDVIERTPKAVVRELPAQNLRGLAGHGVGTFSGWVYSSPDRLNLPYRTVAVTTPVGLAPAWYFPAADPDSSAWAVIVHGRGTTRAEGLRAVPLFHEAGYHTLVASYRNDGDAPDSPDGRYGLGQTEWPDIEAAIDYARSRGATRVTLMGWSMGGAIALQTALQSEYQDLLEGLVLESPVIDWRRVLDYQGAVRALPWPIRLGAMRLLGTRHVRFLTGLQEPIDLDRLDLVRHAQDLDIPILLLHSDDDGFVPADGSRALAAARPDLVRFEPYSVARHTKLWNYDPDRWDHSIRHWLRERTEHARPHPESVVPDTAHES